MGKEYLIDTNSVIDYLDNKLPECTNQLLDNISSRISVITRIELLSWSGVNQNQTIILETFIGSSIVFPLDEPVIEKTIEIRKKYKVKVPDAIIAATAIINNSILITHNIKDFKDIENLEILNPYI